jgi:DNA-binding IclR family transcriptional regulator
MTKRISSLQKGLDILCSFTSDNEHLSAQSIARDLNLPLSTTYRYLQTLEERAFLSRNSESRGYNLGPMILRLGHLAASQTRLIHVVMPEMESLSSLSGETVLLTVLSGWRAVCLERIETRKLIKMSLERGSSLPLHAGASSKILLAYQEDSFVDSMIEDVGLERFTSNTITSPGELRRELQRIRDRGFALSDGEVDKGAIAISCPIFDYRGKMLAALTVAGPRERINTAPRDRLIELVVESGEKASNAFGYRPPKTEGTRIAADEQRPTS